MNTHVSILTSLIPVLLASPALAQISSGAAGGAPTPRDAEPGTREANRALLASLPFADRQALLDDFAPAFPIVEPKRAERP